MRYSQLFGKTTKTEFKDASVTSHQLLLRAGFIRPLSTGRYTFLPLGLLVRNKIEQIIRQHMLAIGAQELVVPDLHPIEIWQSAHRDKKFGASMMRVTDRNNAEFTLGATAEVIMVDLVKQFNISYKDLPINVFQFSKKFRDEARPSGGLLRTREFVMKDGYSFHKDEADLIKTYQKYWDAYLAIAKDLDLAVTTVESDNGAIGGSISHEFMVETDVGEDTIVKCACGYAANLETAVFTNYTPDHDQEQKQLKEVEAIRGNTMEDGVKLHHKPLWQQIKDVMYVNENDNKDYYLAVIRGDYMVNETKLKNLIKIDQIRPASDDEIRTMLHSEPGFISPVGIKDHLTPGIKLSIIADSSLTDIVNAYGGANEKNKDLINININRDYQPDLIGDIAQAQPDFVCGHCHQGKLKIVKAVEFGNIFNIGHVYTKPMAGDFTDIDGQEKPLYMGSYGIGLGRAMACVVETHHDDLGIIWPKPIAPYQVYLINLVVDSSTADDLYQRLLTKNIEVLYDDRADVSAGQKFADADLIGIPQRIVVSDKTLTKKSVELKDRLSTKTELVPLEQAATHIYT